MPCFNSYLCDQQKVMNEFSFEDYLSRRMNFINLCLNECEYKCFKTLSDFIFYYRYWKFIQFYDDFNLIKVKRKF